MCGRYTQLFSWEELYSLLELSVPPEEAKKSFNFAPTQTGPVILKEESNLNIHFFRWGLIPKWMKEPKKSAPLINARAESINEKPSFKSAFGSRRCIVPASGYYEWISKDDKTKQAYYITPINSKPLLLAGIWENWSDNQQSINSFSIITTAANNDLSEIHDRMPVILKPEEIKDWLNDAATTAKLLPFLKPFDEGEMQFHKVSSLVNTPKNNSADCIAPTN